MVNDDLAQIFSNMSAYMEMQSDQKAFFRSRAFRKASEVISKFPYDFADPQWYTDIEKLKKIEGIGQSTAEHIQEYVKTGKIKDYEKMKKESPVKLEELLKIQGIGPKKILKLYKELNVTDIKSLEKIANKGKIATLEGFGEKSQNNILESIKFAIINKDRVSIATAEAIITPLLLYMKQDKNLTKIEPAGSYRRKRETVGDVDILISSKDPKSTMDHFVKYKEVEKVLGHGETKSSIWLKSKIQVDVRLVDVKDFGSALQYFTGNKEHNVKLRNISISKGYKLSEYGLVDRKTEKPIESEDEKKVYELLVGHYIVPELRENLGEIEAAQANKLPNLITLKDIKGDLQMHTTHSDGINSIEEMAKKGIALGYKYIGITDHFGKLQIANAISEKEFSKYINDIRKADAKIKDIKIYASGEIEIDKDGNLEFDKDALRQLDYVIASVHFSTKMAPVDMTKRIIKALKDPLTKILAHPTGRIIGQRPGFEFDYQEVFKVAREENVALEINAHPMRLDLNNELVKMAVDLNCKIIINTDSHSIHEMDYMRYGVDVARRGWLTTKNLATAEDLSL